MFPHYGIATNEFVDGLEATIWLRRQPNFYTKTYDVDSVSQVGHFLNKVVQELTGHYAFIHKKSTPYYPQTNDQDTVDYLKENRQQQPHRLGYEAVEGVVGVSNKLQDQYPIDPILARFWTTGCYANRVSGPEPLRPRNYRN